MDRNMLVRAVAGLVFIAVVIGAVIWSFWSMVTLFGIVALLGAYEFYKLRVVLFPDLKLWPLLFTVLTFYIIIVTGHAAIFIDHESETAFPFLQHLHDFKQIAFTSVLLFIFLLITDLFIAKNTSFPHSMNGLFAMFYISLPFGLFTYVALPLGHFMYQYENILIFFILLWTNDTFAYLTGKFIGRTKLWERISPKKTWEGFFGGLLATVAVALILAYNYEPHYYIFSIIPAVIISVFATLGDLSESLLKRQAGVKDSGNIIPGHGGILDRFDGVLLSLPALFVIIYLSDL